jgi:two-component system, NtrC family, sensor kinase
MELTSGSSWWPVRPLRAPHADETSFDAALAEASFRAVIERLPDAVVVVHRDHTILYANPSAGVIFGFDKSADLLGRSVTLLMNAAEGEGMCERLSAILATGVPLPWRELRATRRDGGTADLEVSGTRVAFGGKPAVLALLRDVSERRALAGTIREADRMISAAALAADVVHEIESPLSAVIANLEWLVDQRRSDTPSHDAEVLSALDECKSGVQRIGDVVRRLESFARSQSKPQSR